MATFTSTQAGNWGTGTTWVGGTAPSSASDDIVINHSGVVVDAAKSCATLTFTGTAVKTGTFQLNATLTVSGAVAINGNSTTNRVLVLSNTVGTARTFSAGSISSLTNVDFQDITGAGTATWAGTSIGDCGGNTNITPTTATTRYGVAAGNWSSTAVWSTSSGGSAGASVPLSQDNVVLDASSGAGTYTIDMPRIGKDLTCTGFTRTLARGNILSSYGSLTLGSGMTVTGSSGFYWQLMGRGSHTFDTAGITLGHGLIIGSTAGGSYSQQSALNLGSNFLQLYIGASNSYSITAQSLQTFSTSNWTFGSSVITLNSSSNVVSVVGGTISAVSTTFSLTDTSTSTKTIAGGGKTYGTVTVANAATTNAFVITGSNTFTQLTTGTGVTLRPTSGTTQTVTGLTVATAIDSTSAGSAATISKASGVVSLSAVSIKDSTATGGADFRAGSTSTNVSGNTGWSFTNYLTRTATGSGIGTATVTGVRIVERTATGTGLGTAVVVGSRIIDPPGVVTLTLAATDVVTLTVRPT